MVLDEVGCERAAILVGLDAGSMALSFAATKPERTSALILFNTTAKYLAADDYPIGIPRGGAQVLLGQLDQLWGIEGAWQLCDRARLTATGQAGSQGCMGMLGTISIVAPVDIGLIAG